ncbi:hypothetical protein OZL92_00620 [Bacillus sonorensis]|uniref:Glucanohydrolase YtlQ n=2 Tax=Bacillus sonorensis TaxID=119858 RepID=M5PAY9_9BACI|nr:MULTISPECIES: hypothetical protein [Bacillus]TWK74180.1 hypothetical protein CHCC20335_4151 [Bacillus paralicheniformis]ASB87875.1 uncharacterized protein S101395_01365 [Bacillus sonorensis]EME76723.1 glucanohydrolase YtlQ [Bacillus sonorensis L12]MBG9915776.1 hypothetical protein [Bacillus sonorensis]MCF7617209.1 hypothetical protein [Bacillus sonorensis]
MAQIIKIQDCISRYEQDPYHYTNQFIRLKKQRWQTLEDISKAKQAGRFPAVEEAAIEEPGGGRKKKFSLKRKKEVSDINSGKEADDQWFNGLEAETDRHFMARIPADKKELASFFKEYLYQFQLKWASSTISDISSLSREINNDKILQILAQQLPDSYFLMYRPVLQVNQADVELSIIIFTPLEIYCAAFLEGDKESTYLGSKHRFWKEKTVRGRETSVLNPLTELFRTGSVLSGLLKGSGVELPVRKAIISRTSYIDYPEPPYGIEIYDRRQWSEWLARQQKNTAPIKSRQLKAASLLLSYGVSNAKRRKEWLD